MRRRPRPARSPRSIRTGSGRKAMRGSRANRSRSSAARWPCPNGRGSASSWTSRRSRPRMRCTTRWVVRRAMMRSRCGIWCRGGRMTRSGRVWGGSRAGWRDGRATGRGRHGKTKGPISRSGLSNSVGGAEEDRTPDLRIANATLSQLSYRPNSQSSYTRISALGNRGYVTPDALL
ncbi:hypothetical protein F01_30006 [Burkholderia cenocepacia]|nr:hypothetical protein F01_30006 [Burkholderia cenocepacia]